MSMSPAPASPRRKIVSSVGLVLALLASLVAFSASSASAVEQPNGEKCYEEVHQWQKYVKGVVQYRTWGTGSWSTSNAYPPFDWEPWGSPVSSQPSQLTGSHNSTVGSTWWEWVGSVNVQYRKQTTHFKYEKETLQGKEIPCDATAKDPKVTQSGECDVEGYLKIYDTTGVQYLFDGDPIAAGTHPGPLSGTVTAEAKSGYVLTNPGFEFEVDIPAAEACGWGFAITKVVDDPSSLVDPDQTFEVSLSCEYGDGTYEDSVSIKAGQIEYFTKIPAGATPCTVTEATPVGGLPSGVVWNAPTYDPDNVVSIDDGCALIVRDLPVIRALVQEEITPIEPCVTIGNSYRVLPPPPNGGDDPEDEPDVPGTETIVPDEPEAPPVDPPAVGGIEDEAGVADAGATLPRTGDDSGSILLVGALLLGLGAVFRTISRRLS